MNFRKKIILGILVLAFLVLAGLLLFSNTMSMPTTKELGIQYRTIPAFEVSPDVEWQNIDFAKEMINVREKMVVVNGGSNPIPLKEWKSFEVSLPWKRNIDRHLLFQETAFLRSPNVNADCKNKDCFTEREYKGYTWLELAQPVAIDFIPSKTDIMKPEEGYLTVKIIKKCQAVVFKNEIYELSDTKGNKYVMHATETGSVNLNVILPEGFSLKKVKINKPLVIVPFGENGDCYFNIVGDHMGQGYHQYKYATSYYPE